MRFTIDLNDGLHTELKAICALKNETMGAAVTGAICQYILENKNTPIKPSVKNVFREALDKVSVLDFCKQLPNIDIEKKGDFYKGYCPLEKETSKKNFSISTSKDIFYCFGCGHGGDIIELVRILKGLTTIQAVEFIITPEKFKEIYNQEQGK